MGIIPLFFKIGAKLTPFFYDKNLFCSIKTDLGLKYFKLLKIVQNPLASFINAILISYVCVDNRSSKPFMKHFRVKSIYRRSEKRI